MPVFWKTRKRKGKSDASVVSGPKALEEEPEIPAEGSVLLLPVLLSTLAKQQTSNSDPDSDDYDNNAFTLAVTHVVRREDGSGEYAEGRWEEHSRGSIQKESWNYRVHGPFRAYLSYARPDFPDVPQPYKGYAIQGEICGTGVRWTGEDLLGNKGPEGCLDVPGLRIPFAAQVLCYRDTSTKGTTTVTDLPWG